MTLIWPLFVNRQFLNPINPILVSQATFRLLASSHIFINFSFLSPGNPYLASLWICSSWGSNDHSIQLSLHREGHDTITTNILLVWITHNVALFLHIPSLWAAFFVAFHTWTLFISFSFAHTKCRNKFFYWPLLKCAQVLSLLSKTRQIDKQIQIKYSETNSNHIIIELQ